MKFYDHRNDPPAPPERKPLHPSVLRVLRMREAGNVQRCHTLPHVDSYTNAKHTFDMLGLLLSLHALPISADLMRAIVLHDYHERWIGDIPGAIKPVMPEFAQQISDAKAHLDMALGSFVMLDADDARWLKALDRIEFFLWCADQVAMGNRHIEGRLTAVVEQLKETTMPKECQEFLDNFKWERTPDAL